MATGLDIAFIKIKESSGKLVPDFWQKVRKVAHGLYFNLFKLICYTN